MGQLSAVHNYGNSNQNITNIFDSWQRVEVENHNKIIDFKHDGLSIFGGDGLSMTVCRCDTTPPPPLVKDLFKIESAIKPRLLIVSTSFKTPTKGQKEAKKSGFKKSGFNRNSLCGFNRAVLTENKGAQSSSGTALSYVENPNQLRSLNIPYPKNSNTEQPNKVKKTNNRKRPVHESHVEVDGVFYEVNASEKYAIYPEILTSMVRQISIARHRHGKVFSMRFELRLTKEHDYDGSESIFCDNGYMTAFIKRLEGRLKHHYKMSHIGFQWVREMGKEKDNGKVPHWHMSLFLDGQKVDFSSVKKLMEHIKGAWSKNELAGYASLSSESCLMVIDEVTFRKAVYQHSYLSKTRSKGYRPEQTKDYGSSRLKKVTTTK